MKIKFGAIVVDGSGKLGGHVFAKNRAGHYIRTKTTPMNPQTVFQTAVRAIFAAISSAWSAITADQRKSWADAVESYKRTNIFGDLKTPSAKALFQRLNQNRSLINLVRLDIAPQPKEVLGANFKNASIGATGLPTNLSLDNDLTGTTVLIYATPPVSAGTEFVKNKLRFLGVKAGTDGVDLEVSDLYDARFGPLPSNVKVFYGVRTSNSNGQVSPMSILSSITFSV